MNSKIQSDLKIEGGGLDFCLLGILNGGPRIDRRRKKMRGKAAHFFRFFLGMMAGNGGVNGRGGCGLQLI